MKLQKCKYCGDELRRLANHEKGCAKLTDDQRKQLMINRRYRYNWQRRQGELLKVIDQPPVNGKKRLRLCISVELEQIKLLLPFIEIDKVEIA